MHTASKQGNSFVHGQVTHENSKNGTADLTKQNGTADLELKKGTANLSKDRKNSILEDAFEAVIGAIFIDSGWDITNSTILNLYKKELAALSSDMTFKDSKTELQEYLQLRVRTQYENYHPSLSLLQHVSEYFLLTALIF